MKTVPKATKSRLILLHSVLKNWNKEKITSIEISSLLGCKDTLVRYDLKFVSFKGGVSNGYDVKELLETLSSFLELESNLSKNLCIVGLGRLGEALLDNGIFEGSGYKVVAGFDSSVNRVEMIRSTFELYPANRIESVCQQKRIEYAMLCCSDREVEKMVQRLVNAGIKGIVNYTQSVFALPDGIKVVNVSPVMALQLIEK